MTRLCSTRGERATNRRTAWKRTAPGNSVVGAVVGLAMAAALAACGDDGPEAPTSTLPTTVAPDGQTGSTTTTTATPPTPSTALGTATAPEASPSTSTEPPAPSSASSTPGSVARLGDPDVTFTHLGERREGLLDVVPAPDGRMYQVFQSGSIELTDAEGGDAETALDLGDLTQASGEQGLLGLAVDPDGRHAYVDYTDTDGNTVIAEYAVAADASFDPDSARIVLTIEQPYANHNGGDLQFGPDGYLYVATGDGGSANDPERRALDLSSLLGKLLRIDPHGDGDIVPPDNPFVDDPQHPDARPEVWSYGLRNPWRFDFDEVTGDLWIADVGQSSVEEIDVARADDGGRNAGRAVNFGWSAYEGHETVNDDQLPLADDHQPPLASYGHEDGRCSVSGGAVNRGDRIPELAGGFVFGDHCSGELWAVSLDGSGGLVELGDVPAPAAVRGVHGELYVASLTDGLYRIDPA